MAMSSADICSSATSPVAYAPNSQRISSPDSWRPSRLAVIRLTASVIPAPGPGAALGWALVPALGQVGAGERGGQQDPQLHRAARGLDQEILTAGFEQELPAAAARQQRLPVAR